MKSTGVAVVLSFIIPGLGIIYCEQIIRGALIFLLWALMIHNSVINNSGWFLAIAAAIWLWNIYEARRMAQAYNVKQRNTSA